MRRQAVERPRRGQATEDEIRLWREATRDVRPLIETARVPEPPPAAPTAQPPASTAPSRSVSQLPAHVPAQPLPVVQGRGSVAGLDRRSAMRLRRGTLAVEARLDLHGMTQEEAHHALNGFLSAQIRAERRVVLVITGRGFSQSGREPGETGGILRRSLPRWLHEGANRERVLAYSPAQPRHGGNGAFYVLLRRRRD